MANEDDKRLGKYLLRSKLGQGGMGTVYLATDTRLKRDVAVKVLPKELASDDAVVKRFLREARAAARLNHPNVVAVYDVDQQRGHCFLVMELIVGCSAADLIGQGTLSWPEASRLIAEACRGLAAAHEVGLIHRDIKPSNILRTNTGLVKLADFGLAKVVDDSRTAVNPLTRSGAILGTPQYMSPEQCQGEPLDARSDIYSLGATYFALLTGQPPFADSNPLQVMFAHCSKPTPDPRTLRPELPEECSAIVMEALAKKRAERFASANELLSALNGLLTSSESQTLESAPSVTRIHDHAIGVTSATVLSVSDGVEPTVVITSTAPGAAPVKLPRESRRERRALAVSLCGVLLVLASVVLWIRPKHRGGVSGDSQTTTNVASSASAPRATALELLADFPTITSEVRGVAFSHDAASVFTASRDGGVRQWSIADRKVTREFLTNAKDVHAVAASRVWLVAGGEDRVLWLWKLGVDQPAIKLAELPFTIMSLAVSPNGRRLAVGTSNSVELYELSNDGGRRIREVADSDDRKQMVARSVHGVAFSSDSRWLAATSWEKIVGVWDAENGELKAARRELDHELMSVAFVPGEQRLIFGAHYSEGLTVWDFGTPDARPRAMSSSTGKNVRSVTVTPHGIAFVNGEWDGIVRVYDIERDTALEKFQQSTRSGVTNMALSTDGRRLATCGGDQDSGRGYLHVWNLLPDQTENSP